ncbi:hypothetical protein ACFQV4_13920 [Streptomyces thermocarboxydus]
MTGTATGSWLVRGKDGGSRLTRAAKAVCCVGRSRPGGPDWSEPAVFLSTTSPT